MNIFVKPVHLKEGCLLFVLTLTFCALPATRSPALDMAAAGRKIFAEHRDSVITLELSSTTRMTMYGSQLHSYEGKSEITATVIDPSGLAVFSLSASNPEEFIGRLLSGGDEDIQMESTLTEITMRFADGRETPGNMVIRDKDLDIGFVRPVTEQAEHVSFLDLSANKPVEILEPVVFLKRLGRESGWAPSVIFDRVTSVLTRPGTFYLPGEHVNAYGCPAFNIDGDVVGVMVLRITPGFSPGEGTGFGSMFGGMSDLGIYSVILPAAEILEAAGQIPGAAAEN